MTPMLEAPTLTLRRTLDASFLNQIVAHQQVRDMMGVADASTIDLTAACADARNITLLAEHGGFIFKQWSPGYYELHTMFEPRGQGRERYWASVFAARYMFLRTDATELVTKVDRLAAGMRAADLAVRQFGFRRTGDAQDRYITYSLAMSDWAQHDTACVERGEAFHEQLEAAKAAIGSERKAHPNDPCHNGIVGAAYACVLEGQVLKGVNFYNRWAQLAGYEPIIMLGAWPPVIDLHDAIVTVTDGAMDMVLVR